MDYRTKYIRTERFVSAHGVKNEVYTCVTTVKDLES